MLAHKQGKQVHAHTGNRTPSPEWQTRWLETINNDNHRRRRVIAISLCVRVLALVLGPSGQGRWTDVSWGGALLWKSTRFSLRCFIHTIHQPTFGRRMVIQSTYYRQTWLSGAWMSPTMNSRGINVKESISKERRRGTPQSKNAGVTWADAWRKPVLWKVSSGNRRCDHSIQGNESDTLNFQCI